MTIAAWVLGFWSSEEVIVLPALLIVYSLLFPAADTNGWRRWRWLVPVVLVGAGLLVLNALRMTVSRQSGYFQPGLHMLQNVASFNREMALALFVPRREMLRGVPGPVLLFRAGLALAAAGWIGLCLFRRLRVLSSHRRHAIFLYLWFLLFLAAFLLRPMGWLPQARYLYAASLGGCFLGGLALDVIASPPVSRRHRLIFLLIIVYMLGINIFTFHLLLGRLKQAEWSEPQGLDILVTRIIPEIQGQLGLGAPFHKFYFPDLPLDPAKLEPAHVEAAMHYYYRPGVKIELSDPGDSLPANTCVVRWNGSNAVLRCNPPLQPSMIRSPPDAR